MSEYSGELRAGEGRYALVASRFNSFIVDQLVNGATDGLMRHGVAAEKIDVARAPGALEIPLIAKRLASSGAYVAVIALGAVIRGETSHYDIVANNSAKGIADASLSTGVPIINAILTCDTLEQAINRAGAKAGNKGFDAAAVAIEMVNLLAKLPPRP